MPKLTHRETQELKTLLETDMDEIGERIDNVEVETKTIRTKLNRVKSKVIRILGLNEEESSDSTIRTTDSSWNENEVQDNV